MNKNKLIAIKSKTKEELDNLKLCKEESYNSLLKRILPDWAIILRNKLNQEGTEAPSQIQNDDNSDP